MGALQNHLVIGVGFQGRELTLHRLWFKKDPNQNNLNPGCTGAYATGFMLSSAITG